MNDPFAMLNPIDKPKAAPVYGGPPAAPVAPLHPVGGGFPGAPGMGMGMPGMGMGMGMGGGMGMGMSMGGGMGPVMGMGMGGMAPGMGGMAPGMGGMAPGMGGMPPGMGGGIPQGMGGMPPGMGMGQPQHGGGQEPIMYDNIKNLLQQKPKPAGAMRDDTSMDFLENLGSAKANSVSVTSPTAAIDPFGGPAAPVATVHAPAVSLGAFEFPGGSSSSPSLTDNSVSPSNGAKSSALADRLANGRRKTQEAQRQQLGISVGAFSQSSGAPKISLKELAPQSSTAGSSADREARAPSLEDFASGKPVFHESDPFGMGSSSGGSRTSSHSEPATSSSASTRSQPASAFDSDGSAIFSDSDADFESKLNGGSASGSSRHMSSGNLGGSRTGSNGAVAAKATMDFGW